MILTNDLPDFNESELKILPIEKSETIPSTWYTDKNFFEFEKKILFGKNWQLIGHISQIPNQGDYILQNFAGQPVIVVRENQNKINAFYNVCRHRGGPLAVENGNCSIFQCKYHGWTYKLDGSLRGVPRFDRVELFDKKDYGLIPINFEVWDGLIFINLSDPKLKLTEIISGISEQIYPIDLSNKKFYKRVEYFVNCNWKVYIDNYLEGYHIPFVHPELTTLLDYSEYETITFDYYSLQRSPIKEEENFYSSEKGSAYYYFVFPNMMLNILPGRLQTNLVLPLSAGTCLVIFDYYYDDLNNQKIIENDIEYSHKIQQEDIEICELVQKGLQSIAYNKGRFSVETEQGVYHFQSLLKKTFKENFQKKLFT